MASKRLFATLLAFAAFVCVAAFVFLLFASANSISVPGVNNLDAAAIVALVILGLIALTYILMMVLRKSEAKEAQVEEAEVFFIPEEEAEPVQAKPVQSKPARAQSSGSKHHVAPLQKAVPGEMDAADLAVVPLGSQTWSGPEGSTYNFHFPRPAKKGLFANDYVDIGGGKQVKMATLIAAPTNIFAGAQEEPITPSRIE